MGAVDYHVPVYSMARTSRYMFRPQVFLIDVTCVSADETFSPQILLLLY